MGGPVVDNVGGRSQERTKKSVVPESAIELIIEIVELVFDMDGGEVMSIFFNCVEFKLKTCIETNFEIFFSPPCQVFPPGTSVGVFARNMRALYVV